MPDGFHVDNTLETYIASDDKDPRKTSWVKGPELVVESCNRASYGAYVRITIGDVTVEILAENLAQAIKNARNAGR